MAFDFPASPADGAEYSPVPGLTYVWHSPAWKLLSTGGSGGGGTPSDALPLIEGTASAGTFVAYSRGDHVHPANAVPGPPGATGPQGPAGPAGSGSTPSDVNPQMNGSAASGASALYSRGDHIHPSDTSRYAANNPSGYQTAAQVTTALAPYAPLASPVFTGNPTAPTPTAGDNDTSVATTAFVTTKASGYLPLAGGALTGPLTGTTAAFSGNVNGLNAGFTGAMNAAGYTATSGTVALIVPATTARSIIGYKTDTSTPRWAIYPGDSQFEGGSNGGANFQIVPFADNGTGLTTALAIERATGKVTINGALTLQYAAASGVIMANTAASGSPYIQIMTNGTAMLASTATAYKPGGGSWTDSSDARIKDVAGEYKQGLTEVLKLRPVIYSYKGNDSDEAEGRSVHSHVAELEQRFVGLVAQEAELALPGMVTKRAGFIDGKPVPDLRDLNPSELIYALVNAVKTLEARLAALESPAGRKN